MLRADEQPFGNEIDKGAEFAIEMDADFAYEASEVKAELEEDPTLLQRLASRSEGGDTQLEGAKVPFSLSGVKLQIPHGAFMTG